MRFGIVIDGTSYEAVECNEKQKCRQCDLHDSCRTDGTCISLRQYMGICSIVFKKRETNKSLSLFNH